MTYKQFITNILMSRGRFNGCTSNGIIMEKHHIIPRCKGGNNNDENLIMLYPREHFIAHQLLAQENPDDSQLKSAWWLMSHINRGKYKLTPDEYEAARIAFCNRVISDETRRKTGEASKRWLAKNGSPMYGKHHTEESKAKISQALKGKPKPDSFKEKLRGRKLSTKTKQKISEALKGTRIGVNNPNYGKPRSEETKQKIGAKVKGENNGMYGMKGALCPSSIKVYCIELDKQYESITEATIDTGACCTTISLCCQGKAYTTGLHPETGEPLHWVYAKYKDNKDYINNVLNAEMPRPQAKRQVYCKELDAYFQTIGDAARATGAIRANISACCIGRRKHAGRHYETGEPLSWEYVDEVKEVGVHECT